jgi:hypothetical protein
VDHPEDALLYAECLGYAQNLAKLQEQIKSRKAACKANGSFDPYLDQIMIPRAELLVKLINNMNDGFTHD